MAVKTEPTPVGHADLPDVSTLLARLLDERIPLALMVDLASPVGPRSDEILELERDE